MRVANANADAGADDVVAGTGVAKEEVKGDRLQAAKGRFRKLVAMVVIGRTTAIGCRRQSNRVEWREEKRKLDGSGVGNGALEWAVNAARNALAGRGSCGGVNGQEWGFIQSQAASWLWAL